MMSNVSLDPDTVFCIQCRRPISLAVSNIGKGLCHSCIQDAQIQIASQAADVFNFNTGLGICPQCKSPNLIEFDNKRSANTWPITTAALICILIGFLTFPCGILFWMIAGIFLLWAIFTGPQKIGTSRGCRACGHRWPV